MIWHAKQRKFWAWKCEGGGSDSILRLTLDATGRFRLCRVVIYNTLFYRTAVDGQGEIRVSPAATA